MMKDQLFHFDIYKSGVTEDIKHGSMMKIATGSQFVRMLICLSGSVELVHMPQSYLLRKGSFAVINPGFTYALRGHDQGELCEIELNENLFRESCGMAGLGFERLQRGMEYSQDGNKRYVLTGRLENDAETEQLLEAMLKEAYERRVGYRQMLQGMFVLLGILVRRSNVKPGQDREDSQAGKIRDFICRNYREITADDTAKAFSCHVNTINRLLKKEYGCTFTQLLQEYRLNLASRLICLGNMPIHEVAAECGYANVSYFYRIFQEHYGITPKQMRKMHQRRG